MIRYYAMEKIKQLLFIFNNSELQVYDGQFRERNLL